MSEGSFRWQMDKLTLFYAELPSEPSSGVTQRADEVGIQLDLTASDTYDSLESGDEAKA